MTKRELAERTNTRRYIRNLPRPWLVPLHDLRVEDVVPSPRALLLRLRR